MKLHRFLACLALNALWLGALGSLGAYGEAGAISGSPLENPPVEAPVVAPSVPSKPDEPVFVPLAIPDTEWALHKTEDGTHPDGNEQAMIWLMNRARTDPEAEGIFLAGLTASNIVGNYSFFGVDLEKMKSEFALLARKPPGAFDRRLYAASEAHSQFMIAKGEQTHEGQLDLVTASGFAKNGGAVSVFWNTQDPVHGHAALNVDWGNDGGAGDGMQPGRGHRAAIMEAVSRPNVGLAMVVDNDSGTAAGPLVTSIAYYQAREVQDHFNKFIVGTVWNDDNSNGLYDPGEGLAGVTVMPDIGTYFAITGDAGGFSIPALIDDDYIIAFSGGELAEPELRLATVAGESVLVVWNEEDSYSTEIVGDPIRPDFVMTKIPSGFSVEWVGLPEHTYTLQKGSDLVVWVADGRTIEVDGTTRRVTITHEETQSGVFFRLKVERGVQ